MMLDFINEGIFTECDGGGFVVACGLGNASTDPDVGREFFTPAGGEGEARSCLYSAEGGGKRPNAE